MEDSTTSGSLENNSENPQKSTFRYLALGDSYTIGESVDYNDCFPVQLKRRLENEGFGLEEVEIIARSGWTSRQLIDGIEAASPEGNFDFVTLLIGVNNQYQKLDTSEYRLEFRQLLQQAIAFAENTPEKVMVLSIPDYSVTPFASNRDTAKIALEINAFNAINLQETGKASAQYFDITEISRKAKSSPDFLASDGLHPSAKMYAEWVDLVFLKATEILKSQPK